MEDALLYFYSAAAQISIVLLGFWWAILTFKWDEWMRDAARRRLGYYISLHFLLPAIMSLLSIISQRTSAVWRVGFAAGGATGVYVARLLANAVNADRGPGDARPAFGFYGLALVNLAIVVVAVFAPSLSDGSGLDAVHIEAILTGVLLFVSVQLAWWLFVEERRSISE